MSAYVLKLKNSSFFSSLDVQKNPEASLLMEKSWRKCKTDLFYFLVTASFLKNKYNGNTHTHTQQYYVDTVNQINFIENYTEKNVSLLFM